MACLRIITLIQLAPANYTAREAQQPALFLITRSRALVLGVLFSVAFSAKRSYRGREAWYQHFERVLTLAFKILSLKPFCSQSSLYIYAKITSYWALLLFLGCSLLAFLEVKQTQDADIVTWVAPRIYRRILEFSPLSPDLPLSFCRLWRSYRFPSFLVAS